MKAYNDYEEIITTMGDLKEGDQVLGTDGKWHDIDILQIQKQTLYRFITDEGVVRCSGDHEWKLFIGRIDIGKLSTESISNSLEEYKYANVGVEDGPVLLNIIKEDFREECRCITVLDSEDHQFEILTDEENPIFTGNCQGRAVCGRINGIASSMILGNSLGTAIDSEHKGGGIVSSAGVQSNIRYYYADPKDIAKWFNERGLDNMGYPPENTEEELVLTEGVEEINLDTEVAKYEFEDNRKEINLSKNQEFDNI